MKIKLHWLLFALASLCLQADVHWRNTAARFPQAMSVLDHVQQTFVVEADGKCLATTRYRATILKEQGIPALSQMMEAYSAKYDRATVLRAEVIGPDGRVTVLHGDHIQDLPLPAGDSQYRQDVRMVLISFPQLQVGATLEVAYEIQRDAPPMDHAFSMTQILQGEVPILGREIRVDLPAGMALRWQIHRGVATATREDRPGRTVYTWQVGAQDPLLVEPAMPSLREVAPVLVVSTIPDWKAVSRWYAGLAADGQVLTPALRNLLAEATASASSREAKIRALFFWVSRRIRYVETVSFSGDKAGFKPASAQETYQRRFGVCRDKAQLLVTLLRGLGVEAYPVLLNAGITQDIEIPCTQFDHLMVGIREADGQFRYLDPTAEDTRQFLPNANQAVYALVCTPEGDDLRLTPLDPPRENGMDIELNTLLGVDGALAVQVKMTARGACDTVCRQFLQGISPAHRERFFQGVAAGLFSGGRMEALILSDPADLSLPSEIGFTVHAPDQAVRAGEYLLFTTPGQGGHLDLLLPFLLSGASAPVRNHPFKLKATLDARVRETLTLPAGYAVRSLPEPVQEGRGSVRLSRVCQATAEGLRYEEAFSIGEITYAGSAYEGLRQLLEKRERLREGKVILVKGGRP